MAPERSIYFISGKEGDVNTSLNHPARSTLKQRISRVAGKLASGERAVADYLQQHPEEAVISSAAKIGEATGTSDATVIRTARKLGFEGLNDLKRALAQHIARRRDPAQVLDERIGRLPAENGVLYSALDAGRELLGEAATLIDGADWSEAVATIAEATHTWTYGIGPSATLAQYLALGLRRSGRAADAWTATGFSLADDLLRVGPEDAVVVIAPLRVFRETGIVIDRAHQFGAKTILLTEAVAEAGKTRADHVLPLPDSTGGAANELIVPLILLHGLVLELVARNRATAVDHHQHLNSLRTELAGNDLDIHHMPDI